MGLLDDESGDVIFTINSAFQTVLDTSMTLASSNIFPAQKSLRAKLGRGLAEIFEQSKHLGLMTKTDNELTILTQTATYLDETNPKDIARKAELLQKVVLIICDVLCRLQFEPKLSKLFSSLLV